MRIRIFFQLIEYMPTEFFINGVEGFWSFAKERLIKYHGISRHKFILYLKKIEYSYNNRNEYLFEMLVFYMLGRNELRIAKTNLS